MLPSTIFLGMTLPLTGKIVSDKFNLLGKKIGLAFSINTAGNIAGALIAGLILLPLLGLCYLAAYLDRVNVGFAKLQMTKDLGLSDAAFATGQTLAVDGGLSA